jgi:3-oxoacyl-[acyl-carrier-protein] synthase II
MRRVAITGVGAVTPLGHDAKTTWEGLLAGRSGVDYIKAFDASDFPVRIAGEVKDWDSTAIVPAKKARNLDRAVVFALAAAREALEDAGVNGYQPERVGVVVGSCVGGFNQLMEQHDLMRERGPDRVSPMFIPNMLVDATSGQIAIELGVRGPNYAVVSACATGSHSIGEGAELIQQGHADAVLVGGTEGCIHPLILAGFCSMRGLVQQNGDPRLASRPFDASRAGFVMAEGATVLMLEGLDAARERGASIYAEVLGFGASNDAYHMAAPDPEAVGVVEMMRQVLDRTVVEPSRVDYINAHGTSTPLGDVAETRAIRSVFGEHAGRLLVSSTKSMLGHSLGATAAVEAGLTVMAMREGIAPPTINLTEPDPECDLDYVPNEARRTPIRIALSNSFGFGGANSALVLRRWDEG